MSFREGLFWGTLGAAIAAAAAALRAPSWALAFVVLFGSAALVVAPAVAGLTGARTLSPWVRALLVGLGLSGLLLAKLASMLMVATHHRPLGAVTFAALALLIVLGLSLVSARVFALAASGSSLARWLGRALVAFASASALLLLVRALFAADLARGVFDLALALGASALLRLPPWPPTLTPKAESLAIPVWLAAVGLAVLTGSQAGFDPARFASPALAAPLTSFFPLSSDAGPAHFHPARPRFPQPQPLPTCRDGALATPQNGGQRTAQSRSIFVSMQRSPSPWDSVLALLRRTFLFALVVLVLGTGQTARADGGAEPPVRTALSEDAARRNDAANHQAPGDAPHLGPGRLAPTPVPPGFNTFDGGWIRFHYHPSQREALQPLISEATQIRRELNERLGVPVLTHVRIDLARTPGEMATFAPAGAPYPDYAAGVAYPELGLVLLSVYPLHANAPHDLVQIFRHELAHIALFDAVAGAHVPRWFNEGFAVFASGETSVARLQTLWTATLADTLIPLDRLDAGFPLDQNDAAVAYAEAADVVRYLVRHRERFRFQGLVERMRAGQDFTVALRDAYGIELTELEQEWREDVAKRYTFWPVLLSGSFIWFGVIGLFAFGYRKRRRRAKVTLARWAVEEAREDAIRQAPSEERVHIVLARGSQPLAIPPPHETEVPKVQHEGQWHTLH